MAVAVAVDGGLRCDSQAPAVSRHSSQGLFLSRKTRKSSSEGTFGEKLDGKAFPAQALSRYRILLCVFFSYLGIFLFLF